MDEKTRAALYRMICDWDDDPDWNPDPDDLITKIEEQFVLALRDQSWLPPWTRPKVRATMSDMEITEGTPATEHVGSDAYPAVVTRVSDSGKTVWVQKVDWRDIGSDLPGAITRARATGGYGADYDIDVTRCIRYGEEKMVRLSSRHRFSFGHARYYRDPHV